MTSSSDFIAKAQLSAYQRWELASLTEGNGEFADHSCVATSRADRERELADAKETAEREGYAAGYATGIAAANESRERLAALLASIDDASAEQRQRILDGVLDFALLVARHMVGETMAVRRERVLPVVADALHQLPALGSSAQVLLNPADVELVRSFLAAEPTAVDCKLIADATIAAGGCRVITAQCDIDATMPTRWRRLLANLGCTDEWLESA